MSLIWQHVSTSEVLWPVSALSCTPCSRCTEVAWVLTPSDLVSAYILNEHAASVFRGIGLGQSLTLALQYVGLPPVGIRLQTRPVWYVGVGLLVYPSLKVYWYSERDV
jgi:hypothetical protein